MGTRGLKIVITMSTAILFSLIAFNNITDYCTNFQLVKTILSMEPVKTTNIQWLAITSPLLQHAAYLIIITWETLTAAVCCTGALLMVYVWAIIAPAITGSPAFGVSVTTMVSLASATASLIIGMAIFFVDCPAVNVNVPATSV